MKFDSKSTDALEALDKAIALSPNSSPAFLNRGVVLGRLGRDGEAIASFDRALSLTWGLGKAQVHLRRGKFFLDRSDGGSALRAYEAVLAIDPRHGNAAACVGVVRFNLLGQPQAALQAFDRAVVAGWENQEVHANRSNCLLALGRFGDALAAADRALEYQEDYFLGRLNRAKALAALGRLGAAIKDAQLAAALDPSSAIARITMCRRSKN